MIFIPYITEGERKLIDKHLCQMGIVVQTKGQLNYTITRLIHQFLHNYHERHAGLTSIGPCYNAFNDAIGILESAKLELFRTIVGPYEQSKKEMNGNISILDKDND